ncbi:MAG: hypothetical protein HY594_02055, partial [Candidatus Omnitrophica bacterium]|nr:hypothetical protein [Candidatus Omnitrophota bacterium]
GGGGGEGAEDYYSPRELYPIIEKILRQRGTPKETALLHGFSRGASQVYALTASDQFTGNEFFALTLANAGGATPDYPPNVEIDGGRFGPAPFSNTRWVLFCGGKDPNPLRDGCEAMHSTRQWVQKLGGIVELLMEDPEAGHGGFHRDPRHVAEAIEVFERLLAAGAAGVVK